jgi:superfamily II DNA or RNA helicase
VQRAVEERHGRVLLTHEMGLGKSTMALAIAAHFTNDWPVLVIAPPVLHAQWADEIFRWLGPLHLVTGPEQVQIMSKDSEVPRPEAMFVILSYGLVTGRKESAKQKEKREQKMLAKPI